MMLQRRQTTAFLIVALAALGAGIGAWSARWYGGTEQPQIEGFLWPEPKHIGTFRTFDQDDREFGIEQLRGHWSFLFFGYTNCPDICPITMSVLNRVQQQLRAEDGQPVQVIFVSVDPERDTAAQLKQYVRHFGADVIGLGGSRQDVQTLTAQVGVAWHHDRPDGDGWYLVDHSAAVFLTDPQGRLVSIFSAPHLADGIIERFRTIRDFLGRQS
jgi:protein SCO1/2